MQQASNSEKNSTPRINCKAPWRLASVRPLPEYKLEVTFNDGTHGFVHMAERVKSQNAGVFSALKDTQVFNKVHLEYGAVTWPDEIDLSPDAMHDAILKDGIWILK
ncbi:MAG: hypothetical protein ACD_45C00025G0002 [uncultured bacterium]|nr:MAG: hypothetical protein ACD_45C00025G0002 [uncultured bacterium]OGT54082.1 MAG: hypothetical protein A3F43_05630 [Gammaproteobacteria bacterium RIFCSPHIGHO2_12_FULL_42_10]